MRAFVLDRWSLRAEGCIRGYQGFPAIVLRLRRGDWALLRGRDVVLGAVLSVSNGPKLFGLISRKGGVLVIRSLTSGGEIPTCTGSGMVSLKSVTVCAGRTRIPLRRILAGIGGGRGKRRTSISASTGPSRLHTCFTRVLPGFSHRHMCPDSVGGLVS